MIRTFDIVFWWLRFVIFLLITLDDALLSGLCIVLDLSYGVNSYRVISYVCGRLSPLLCLKHVIVVRYVG